MQVRQGNIPDLKFSGKSFRLLAFQPMSVSLEKSKSFKVCIQGISCSISLRPVKDQLTEQLTYGGTFIAIDFTLGVESDFFSATNKGLELIQDFLSAISLVEGVTFRDVDPVQIISKDERNRQQYHFLLFLRISLNHWTIPVSASSLNSARAILAHWDGLDDGKRLRRAARQYRKAIGSDGSITAFQHVYFGLEALEKPLARLNDIPSGVEVIKGKCDACGAEFERKRTVLAGVRAYIHGPAHLEMDLAQREQRANEWKKINTLRHELFHSLEGSDNLEVKTHDILPAAMHYLHDGICCLSHQHQLESGEFKIGRRMRPIVFVGRFRSAGLGGLEECTPLLDAAPGYWVEHPKHDFVPEFKLRNPGISGMGGVFFWLDAPLAQATIDDLTIANFETCGYQATTS